MRRQDSDGDGGCREKEGEEDQSGSGWIPSGTTCGRGNCQGRTRKTGLDVGVSQDTSTPHKSGGKCRRRRLLLPTKINGIIIVFKVND